MKHREISPQEVAWFHRPVLSPSLCSFLLGALCVALLTPSLASSDFCFGTWRIV